APDPRRERGLAVAPGEVRELEMRVDVDQPRHQYAIQELQRRGVWRCGDVGVRAHGRNASIVPNQNGAIRNGWRRYGEELSGAETQHGGGRDTERSCPARSEPCIALTYPCPCMSC